METRPLNAFILSLLGGLFILMGVLMAVVLSASNGYPYYLSSYYAPFLATSSVCGVAVLLAAALMYLRPAMHVAWGVIALVLSVGSVIGAATGYYAIFGFIGITLGVLGGALSIAWRSVPGAGGVPAGAARMCTGCGRYVPMMFPYCAYCGTPAPTFPAPGSGGRPPAPPPA